MRPHLWGRINSGRIIAVRLPHMVSVVAVVPAVNSPAVRASPVLPPARIGRRRYKARQHCEGSEKYGKTLDIEAHGFSCLLIRPALIHAHGSKTPESDEGSVNGRDKNLTTPASSRISVQAVTQLFGMMPEKVGLFHLIAEVAFHQIPALGASVRSTISDFPEPPQPRVVPLQITGGTTWHFTTKWTHATRLSRAIPVQLRIHRIASEMLTELGASSKLNAEWEFFTLLRAEGRRSAQVFLETHAMALGRRSTLDIDALLEQV
jgi:hypothetical protein